MADLTWIDVVDSAVKIAAGALIAGGLTFITSKSRQNHEARKTRFEQELAILREVVGRVEESSDFLNDYSHLSRSISLPSGAEQAKKNSELVMSGYKTMGKAQGLAYLIGQTQLSAVLDNMCKSLLEFYYFVSEELPNVDIDEAHEKLAQAKRKLESINKNMEELRGEVTNAYSNISLK